MCWKQSTGKAFSKSDSRALCIGCVVRGCRRFERMRGLACTTWNAAQLDTAATCSKGNGEAGGPLGPWTPPAGRVVDYG